jgi:hypothetical protein
MLKVGKQHKRDSVTAGVGVTGDKSLPVSLTPVIKFVLDCHRFQQHFKKYEKSVLSLFFIYRRYC